MEGFLWALEIPLVKVAILIFYRRVFTGNQRWFRWAFWIMIAYCVAWAIATFVIVMVQCVPIPYFWNRAYAFYKLEPPGTGTCLETTPSQVPVAFLNCIGDLVLILLPFPVLLRLQMNIRRKIELSIIFGLGALYGIPPMNSKLKLTLLQRPRSKYSPAPVYLGGRKHPRSIM